MKNILIALFCLFFAAANTFASSDPRLFPNNKFGINSLAPSAELAEAASLVNTNGDWGWVVIVINKNERNLDHWQQVFNQLNEHHLTPIVRIATNVNENGNWQKPTDTDAKDWAQFLNSLYWPTKNRYVQVYNEVNRASEWGDNVDPTDYARELDKTINSLKAASEDFFILNAPLDLALNTSQNSQDAAVFFQTMEQAVPGIFNKLDGWASHSYPNPDFSASPLKSGRTGIDGYKWELQQISAYTKKDLPIFITETGWKRAPNGERGLSQDDIANFYRIAFNNIWIDNKVAAVAPFLLDYPEKLFQSFSFKENGICLKYCDTLRDLQKVKGAPLRENKAQFTKLTHSQIVISRSLNKAEMEIKNEGNFIWDTQNFTININSPDILVSNVLWKDQKVYPGQIAHATLELQVQKVEAVSFSTQIKENGNILSQKNSSIESKTYPDFIISSIRTIVTNLSNMT